MGGYYSDGPSGSRMRGYGRDWAGQDRDRWRALVNAVMNLRAQQSAGNFLTSYTPVSFSRRTRLHGVSKFKKLRCHKFKLRSSGVSVTGTGVLLPERGKRFLEHDGGSYISKIQCLECVEPHLNAPCSLIL
jgi:hypothetical protein